MGAAWGRHAMCESALKEQNDVSLTVGEKAVELGTAAGRTTPPSAWRCSLVQLSTYDEDYIQSS